MKQFLHATATLSGLIIGVGMFGVPYVIANAGFWSGMGLLLLVGLLVLTIHLLYGEVVTNTPGHHRLPGYVRQIFGNHGRQIVLIIDVVRFWGLQVAYPLVGGTFLSLLFSHVIGGDPFWYRIILFCIIGFVTFFGLRYVEKIEFVLTGFLIVALLFIIVRGLPHVSLDNLMVPGTTGVFSPYGVIMVSLAGAAAIPEIWDLVKPRKKLFRASIIVGTLIPIVLTGLLALTVVGISGPATSIDAISGLQGILGDGAIFIGALAGFLAIITSYLIIALYLQEMLRFDFRVRKIPAWAFAIGVPFLLFLAGTQNFIAVIDIVGSVLFGIEGILIIATAVFLAKRRGNGTFRIKLFVGILAGLLLAFGLLQKLLHLI